MSCAPPTRSATRASGTWSWSTRRPGCAACATRTCAASTLALDEGSGRALVFAAIDNLWKGASGQAVQNLNLMLGLDEADGLL